MTSFDEWFSSQGSCPTADVDELPEGIIERGGEYLARCCCCDEYKPLYVGIDEIPMQDYRHWCGGSPRCCP